MSDDSVSVNNLFDFEVDGRLRVIKFIKTEHSAGGIDSDLYSFTDDPKHELAIYTLQAGCQTPSKIIHPGRKVLEGFIKGKGTLTVDLGTGAKSNYYFESEGRNKEITVVAGQALQWTAPRDSYLVYYEMREAPARQAVSVPITPPTTQAPKVKPKLLLLSSGFTEDQSQALNRLVGTNKKPSEIHIALIENAADPDKTGHPWVALNRRAIEKFGYKIQLVDLRKYKQDLVDLVQVLRTCPVVWLGGGNTFYLRRLLQTTRADEIITKLVQNGTVFVGGSAGAIVAGPTLRYFDAVDDPAQADQKLTDGLDLTDAVVVPHMNQNNDSQAMENINNKLMADGYKTVPLKDGQALLVENDKKQLI